MNLTPQEGVAASDISYLMPLAYTRDAPVYLVMSLNTRQLLEQAQTLLERGAYVAVLQGEEAFYFSTPELRSLDLSACSPMRTVMPPAALKRPRAA